MKIGIMSDIHANAVALEAVLKDMKSIMPDMIIFLGDLLFNGPSPKETYDLLKDAQPTVWIRGNTDDWLNEIVTGWEPSSEIEKYCYTLFSYAIPKLNNDDIGMMKNIPLTISLSFDDTHILCVHGSPRSYSESMDFSVPDEKVKEMLYGVEETNILCGHIHNPFERHIKEKWIINVGSVGYPTDGDPRAAYGVLEIKKSGQSKYILKRVEYDIDENIRLAKLNDFPFAEKYENIIRKAHERKK